MAVASKLITKLNRAVNELDKDEELIKKKVTVKAEKAKMRKPPQRKKNTATIMQSEKRL